MGRVANRPLRRQERGASGAQAVGGSSISISSSVAVQSVVIASWTSSSGRFYYDLAHNRLRQGILYQLVDTHTGAYYWPDEAQSIDENTVRIWMLQDPGASRIAVYYI